MTSPGRIALVGSGEYLPVMQEVEGWLLEGRPARYVQLATAAAPEGDRVLARWHDLGAQAAARLGAEQIVVDVRTRADADNPANADAIAGAGLVYLSGGNPGHLAGTLRGTRVWAAIREAWLFGASVAGCSAGAMALGGYVPDFRHPKRGGTDGLGLVPDIRVLPHFDKYSRMIPDFALRPLVTPGAVVVGIDEDTALVADGPAEDGLWEFRSRGRQSAWTIEDDRRHRVNAPLRLRVDA
jgi:cyanophycinase